MGHPEAHSWDVLPIDSPNLLIRVQANRCLLVEGHLVFEDANGVMIRAFASGSWTQVRWVSPQQLSNEMAQAVMSARIREQASEVVRRSMRGSLADGPDTAD